MPRRWALPTSPALTRGRGGQKVVKELLRHMQWFDPLARNDAGKTAAVSPARPLTRHRTERPRIFA
jgi:hypothetical protein